MCKIWYHLLCTQVNAAEIATYHCPKCQPEHGPSQARRLLKRRKVRIDYVALDQGASFAVNKDRHPHVPSFLQFETEVDRDDLVQLHVTILESQVLVASANLRRGLLKPILVPHVTALCGLQLPVPRKELTVDLIAQSVGRDAHVEVMDVLSQQSESPAWNLGQWQDYFACKSQNRDRIRNVISLEVSDAPNFASSFQRPQVVRDLDLVDKVWVAENDQPRPKVTVYCLMSVAGAYTDFHIDFSGTPVYYTVLLGTKTFLMFPPTDQNLYLYELWCKEPDQNFTWFCDYSAKWNGRKAHPSGGFKVDLVAGDLFMIPSGWIHAVYTPEDAVVVGGNYLTTGDILMHLKIYNIERKTGVPTKYRFPLFNRVMWLASWYYANHPEEYLRDVGNEDVDKGKLPGVSDSTDPETKIKNELFDSPVHNTETVSLPALILEGLTNHLREHFELSKVNTAARKAIPISLIGKDIEGYLQRLEDWRLALKRSTTVVGEDAKPAPTTAEGL